ncbi:MAG: hypothetical protein AB3N64_07280 [Puniceicoccaceae bacterium]
MKNLPLALLITATVLSGCGKKDETPSTVAASAPEAPVVEEVPQEPVAEEAAPATESASSLVSSLTAQVEETVKAAMPEAEETATAAAPEVEETVAAAMPEVEESATSVMPDIKEAAMAAASSVDWANLSWNDVSAIPYDDKEKLLAWAAPQIDSLKDQLSKAVMDKGLTGLASLGDSGWQGAVKTAVEALDTVRNSSPETWELARGALVSAWQTLETEARKYLE